MSIASTMFVQQDVTWVDGAVSDTRNIPSDLTDVLSVGERWFETTREGVILLDGPIHAGMGLPAKQPSTARGLDQALVAARAAGWNVSKAAPWMTFHANGKPSIHVGLMGWLSSINHALYSDDHSAMTYRMRRFHELTGSAFHGTPGVAGTALLRDRYRGKAPRWVGKFDGIDAAGVDTEQRYVWTSPDGGNFPYSHRYDANLQYLGAANVSEVALDELRHTGRRDFNPHAAGYWKIIVPVWNEKRLPHPANGVVGQEKWVTTPTMQLLSQLADLGKTVMPDVIDSWTCERTTRVFRHWATRLADALRDVAATEAIAGDQEALTIAIKRTYRETIGLLYRPGGRIHRPDWHHTIIGMARCNLFRKLHKASAGGRWPESIKVDAVTWGWSSADPFEAVPEAIELRSGPGGWKHEETTTNGVLV